MSCSKRTKIIIFYFCKQNITVSSYVLLNKICNNFILTFCVLSYFVLINDTIYVVLCIQQFYIFMWVRVNWCGVRFSRVLCDTSSQTSCGVRSMFCHYKFPLLVSIFPISPSSAGTLIISYYPHALSKTVR